MADRLIRVHVDWRSKQFGGVRVESPLLAGYSSLCRRIYENLTVIRWLGNALLLLVRSGSAQFELVQVGQLHSVFRPGRFGYFYQQS